jgi:hypothetical protein
VSAVVLEPHGFNAYAVRDTSGDLKGFIAFSTVHLAWHAFDPTGTFVAAASSRTEAVGLVLNHGNSVI